MRSAYRQHQPRPRRRPRRSPTTAVPLPTTPPFSTNMRRAPRSISPSTFPASRSISAIAIVRGFAGAAGNVVINGAAPKQQVGSLDQTLARIPADQVVRVEVGPGDFYGADYAGKSQVLNIILRRRQCRARSKVISTRRSGDLATADLIVPDASASVVLHRGPRNSTCRPASTEPTPSKMEPTTLIPWPTGRHRAPLQGEPISATANRS